MEYKQLWGVYGESFQGNRSRKWYWPATENIEDYSRRLCK